MSDLDTIDTQTENLRSLRLKTETHTSHERLDDRVSNSGAFTSLERYAKFLTVQWRFHTTIEPIFQLPALEAHLPDLKQRQRLTSIEQDMDDLGIKRPLTPQTSPLGTSPDAPTSWGWLYVAEGSNLGAAVLLKRVKEMGLSEEHGARHLAGNPEGRGLHWRRFKSALDEIDMSSSEEDALFKGADAAFNHVRALVEEEMG